MSAEPESEPDTTPPRPSGGHPAPGSADAPRDAVWTIPNALSVLRLLGVPLFLWLILQPAFHGPHLDGWAILVLALSGLTDYLDGKIARALNQTSKLGAVLDPAADRLYILATLVGLAWREIIPIWLVVLLVGRDVLMSIPLAVLKRHGYGALPVHFLGKAATFNLLYAFPLLLLGDGHGALNDVAGAIGWAFAIWGTTLYWLAAGLYVVQVRQVVRESAARA
jgi:cardiolipin synthase